MIYEVTMKVAVESLDEKSAQEKVEIAVKHMYDCLAYDIVTVMPVKDRKELSASENGKRRVVYEKQDETWIIKDMKDNCYVTSCQSDDALAIPEDELEADEMCDDEIMMGQAPHHYLKDAFLKDMMFDDFEGKSWSDRLDEKDLQKAIDEYWAEQNVPF